MRKRKREFWSSPRDQTVPPLCSSSSSFYMEVAASSSSSSPHTSPSSSSSPPSNWEHDVFLSFRGEDTRNSFTDHLYYAMSQRGIDAFRDTEKLRRGKSISPELLKAIEESKFAVTVLSTNYATSTWCLDELAHILDCRKVMGLEVLPVFYHVEPSEIRKQTGKYGKAFAKHETDSEEKMRKVNKWREALEDIAGLSGWHVTEDRRESEVIQEVVNEILNALNEMLSVPERELVGMDARILEIESRLELESTDVLTVGIWGMGGIGKTTLAKEVFKKIRNQFHPSGFVSQVRLQSEVELQRCLCESFLGDGSINIRTSEKGIKLLKKALYKKKVLIVLDDVDNFKQIECLAPGGPLGENIWGGGSRLIITTRDRSPLRDFNVQENKIYEVEKLRDAEAFQLLSQKAFKKDNPPEEFVALSKSFLQYASGLPLAHEVLGSYLSRLKVDEWSEILHRLDDDEDKDIFSVLQISYDGLQGTDKKIFLDIACFFNGEDHVRVKNILKGCGFSSRIGISNLIDKSLIKIERNKLWMHDLLRCLGWHIVRRESSSPGERSRLWLDDNARWFEGRMSWRFEDARNVVMDNTGTTAVEGLFLSLHEKEKMPLDDDPFLTMCNLRLLKIYNVNFLHVHPRYVSKKLRLLEWHECPLESLPSNFTSDKLVEFKMPNSRIKQLWNETLSLRLLILMDLSNCQYLATTPDFSKVPNLERLILEGCTELSVVHPTIGDLQQLVFLNLKGCASLESLPQSISLRSLRIFILSGCTKLEHFPEIVGNMDALSELYLDGTAIRELPLSIQHLEGLVLLNLSGCRNLLSLPSVLCSHLISLKFLYLSLCSSMEKLPENIGYLKHLEELDACDTAIRKVPESISGLKNLILLCFHGCSGLTGLELPNKFSGLRSLTALNLGGCNLAQGVIPDDIGDLFSLQSLDLSENNFSTIPESISQLSELTEISLFKCSKLRWLPKDLPSSLTNVNIRDCPLLTNSSSSWRRYPPQKGLSIINCRKPEEDDIFLELHEFRLGNLEELDLSYCQYLKKIPDLNGVPNLKKLNLEGCEKLSEVHPTIGRLKHLVFLNLKGCVELKSLPSFISLKSLKIFVLSGCSKLEEFPDIEGDNLSELHLDGTALKHLTICETQLKSPILINLSGCRNLLTVPVLQSLKSLNLSGCSRVSILPSNLENMKHLEELDASETSITAVPSSISYLVKLEVLSFCGCRGLRLPKWFSDLGSLKSLNLRRCGLAEEVLDILYCLSSLKILDLGENSFVTIPNDIDRLSSLQQLDLSGNNLVSIPHEIGCLYSLQLLDLSENNFVSIPKSISNLSELTILRLFRCSKLQSLPNNLPFNLKHVYAQECPMLKHDADTWIIRASGEGFCFIHCGKYEQDDDQPSHVPVPAPEDCVELQFPVYIADRVYGKKPFAICFPHSTRIPNLWSHWRSGPSVTIPLSNGNGACMGLALFVVFEILEGNFNKIWELEEIICEFHTDVGPENSLVFQNFMDFKAGSNALCCYEPRGGQFSGMFVKPSSLRASISTKRQNLKVRGCGMRLISEEDAAEFVKSLANQTATQHLDSNFDRHCEYILDEETATGDLMELGSTSTFNADTCSKSNSKIKLRGELLKLYEVSLCVPVSLSHGRNGREKSFHFCFPAPVISTPPWFLQHHAGDVTLCYITENLLDDQRWVGLELYVQFSRCTSTSTSGNNSFFFCVDLCSHDRESIIMHGSLKINSCVGTSDQFVVLHVPRVHFQQQLNQCQGVSALFRTTDAEMEVLVCGSRLAFEHDLEDLTHSLTAGAGTLGQHVLTQPCSQAQPVDWPGADEAETPINCCSRCRSTGVVVPEQAPSSSIVRLRNYTCYLQQQQGFGESDLTQLVHFRSVMLLHSRSLLENRDRNQENIAEKDKSLVLARHHVHIMAETQLQGSYSSSRWKRCLHLLLRQSKLATLSLGGHTISAFQNFDPSSPYNIICFSDKEIPVWFKHEMSYRTSSWSGVGIKLPSRLHEDENWRGLAICIAFEVHDQRPTTSLVKLLCHLRAKDNYCLNPIPMCSITEEELNSLHLGRFIWVTYIPSILLTEFSVVSDVEARIYVSCRGLTVEKCGMRLLYRQEEGEFVNAITECWTSFFDNLPFISQLVEADYQNVQPWTRHELPMLEGHIKVFDPDLIYNAIPPSTGIPGWFGADIKGRSVARRCGRSWELKLPPSSSDKNWKGLALCASYSIIIGSRFWEKVDEFMFTFETGKNGLSSVHRYQMSNEESEFLKRCCNEVDIFSSPYLHQMTTGESVGGEFIWLSYIPRRWFLHQLNDESVLIASSPGTRWYMARYHLACHRFVYADDVEEFKQLCFDLHRPVPNSKKIRMTDYGIVF
ncbi:uncharacterized protein LOC112188838 isoform X2 [Rosa chinensis]|uniref:uncharacterized protein LOC112188838 isoform X2 n=1 Tax=Rosa chinensis TaxID=74649 RepID=UPI001AD90A10|nr:uncharacterized protein LOC112188838 isoform X2 [Rosa chinensis]